MHASNCNFDVCVNDIGVVNGNECYGSTSFNAAAATPSFSCTTTCTGDSNVLCGGVLATQVYQLFSNVPGK